MGRVVLIHCNLWGIIQKQVGVVCPQFIFHWLVCFQNRYFIEGKEIVCVMEYKPRISSAGVVQIQISRKCFKTTAQPQHLPDQNYMNHQLLLLINLNLNHITGRRSRDCECIELLDNQIIIKSFTPDKSNFLLTSQKGLQVAI